MSRSGTYRRQCPAAMEPLIDLALNGRFFVVSSPGPTSYVIKADGSARKHKVLIGNQQRCTCTPAGGELCLHILFVMLRVFKVDPNHEVVWQKSLTDSEVQALLTGTLSTRMPPPRRAVQPPKKGQSVARRPLDDTECPVCCEVMDDLDATTWCRKGCGNSIHVECMREWALHNGGTTATCPYCRVAWGAVRGPKKATPQAGGSGHTATHPVPCKQCQDGRPISGPRFACLRCPSFNLCGGCAADPLVHPSHPFQVYATPDSAPRDVDRFAVAAAASAARPSSLGVRGTGFNAGRALAAATTPGATPPHTPQRATARRASASTTSRRGNPADSEDHLSSTLGNPSIGITGHTVGSQARAAGAVPSGVSSGSNSAITAPPALLTPDEVMAIPMTQWVGEGEEAGEGASSCPTCLQPFAYLEVVRVLPGCGHALHSHCAEFHLTRIAASCPGCGAGEGEDTATPSHQHDEPEAGPPPAAVSAGPPAGHPPLYAPERRRGGAGRSSQGGGSAASAAVAAAVPPGGGGVAASRRRGSAPHAQAGSGGGAAAAVLGMSGGGVTQRGGGGGVVRSASLGGGGGGGALRKGFAHRAPLPAPVRR